jgi:hypothetical protein
MNNFVLFKFFFFQVSKLLRARSMNPSISDRLHEYLKKHGLQEVRKHDIMLPLSELDGEIGMYYILVIGWELGVKNIGRNIIVFG